MDTKVAEELRQLYHNMHQAFQRAALFFGLWLAGMWWLDFPTFPSVGELPTMNQLGGLVFLLFAILAGLHLVFALLCWFLWVTRPQE